MKSAKLITPDRHHELQRRRGPADALQHCHRVLGSMETSWPYGQGPSACLVSRAAIPRVSPITRCAFILPDPAWVKLGVAEGLAAIAPAPTDPAKRGRACLHVLVFSLLLRQRSSGRACYVCGRPVEAPAGLSWTGSLIWALHHPDGDRAVLAAKTLGRLRGLESVPALRAAAEVGTDIYLRAAALRSLIAIDGVEPLRCWLGELSRVAPFNIRVIARRALEGSSLR